MWDFEHPPHDAELAERYELHRTLPALCARELHEGRAGLGLIPIAALTPELAIVPGCAIASLDRVRSIQLVVKHRAPNRPPHDDEVSPALDELLMQVRSIAADTASRSSLAYTEILFHRFLGMRPAFVPTPADPVRMLQHADGALLIGDPALLALEAREAIEASPGVGPCVWIDVAHQWRVRTGLPWVAAVWAARPEALSAANISSGQLTSDLMHSRDAGLVHIDSLVAEWIPRIALAPATIRQYLTANIHYTLTPECEAAMQLFRGYAAEAGVLPRLPGLRFL
jgi:chorismate dehydratase